MENKLWFGQVQQKIKTCTAFMITKMYLQLFNMPTCYIGGLFIVNLNVF